MVDLKRQYLTNKTKNINTNDEIRDKNTYIQKHAAEDSILGRDWWWIVGVQVEQQLQFSGNTKFIASPVEDVLEVRIRKSRENLGKIISIKMAQKVNNLRQIN